MIQFPIIFVASSLGVWMFYVQHQYEPHYRIRIGMEPSHTRGWEELTTFYAFDTAMPGTCKLSVQYTIQSTEAHTLSAEQFRIYTKDPWGIWDNKFFFYCFPAETVLVRDIEEAATPGKSPGRK